MKNLDTLVTDIYKKIEVLSDGKEIKITDKVLDDFGDSMKDALKHWASPRKIDKTSTTGLRMSNIGNETRAAALLDGQVTFQDENQRPGSPLYGNLNLNQLAVAGHSRGGGAALLAAAADPSVNAVLALAPWLEDQFINPTTLDQDVPVLFLSIKLLYFLINL